MIKTFYKKKRIPKVFFKSGLRVRSTAYGENVAAEYLVWRNNFLERREREGDRFLLFAQGSVEGDCGTGAARLPKLALDGVTFETSEDGILSLNGRRVQCDIGTEIKAWAIGVYEEGSFLFVIGKTGGQTGLSAYRLSRSGNVEERVCAAALPATLDAKSTLNVFGRHLFLIHNACLCYYYFTPDPCALEQVAIGGDEENTQTECCKFAQSPVVSDGAGNVFWGREEDVYGIRLGAPAALLRIVGLRLCKVEDLRCRKNTLCVTLRSKSGSAQTTEYYETQAGAIKKAAN